MNISTVQKNYEERLSKRHKSGPAILLPPALSRADQSVKSYDNETWVKIFQLRAKHGNHYGVSKFV
jgi:hypothetical protein